MKNFIESLLEASDLKEHYAYLDEKASQEPSVLVTIFQALPKDWIKLLNNWQQRAAYSRILEAICLTKGKAQIEAAIEIAEQVERPKDVDRMAAFLVSRQDKNDLLELLLKWNSKKVKELLVLVMHELVARGVDLRETKHYADLERTNKNSEFKYLTLFPLECERENSFPTFGIGSSGSSIDYTLSDEAYAVLDRSSGIEVTELVESNSIALALLNWEEASNGTILGLRGKTKIRSTTEGIFSVLKAFEEDTKIKLKPENLSGIFKSLFGACSKGGAYSSGIFGARGRLHTWTSLNRMMSDQEFGSNEQVEIKMKDYDWFRFNTDEWFANEIWDIGIFCLHKNGMEFGLLAGTDID